MKKSSAILIIVVLSFWFTVAQAEEGIKFSELRLFGASNTFTSEPTALNALTAADNVQKLDGLIGLGLEADAKYKTVKFGTRFKYVLM